MNKESTNTQTLQRANAFRYENMRSATLRCFSHLLETASHLVCPSGSVELNPEIKTGAYVFAFIV